MRSATAPELTVLAGLTRQVTWRVKVANGSGTMIDLSTWVESISIDQDIDQPVAGATVTFTRASGVLQTLSPLRTDSTLNVKDDFSYSPQLDLVRAITIEPATTALGVVPVAGDYKLLFKGTTRRVAFHASPVGVECRDEGAKLVDRWVEAKALYGSAPGVAVETVMQQIHDAVLGGGVVPVYTPASPGYLISPAYQQQIQSLMEADVALAQGPGWDVRYKWDNGTSAFRFTFYAPDRAKTVPDYTFGPSGYFDVTKLELEETDIRNAIIVEYRDSADLGNRKTITVTDGPSITKYDRKPLPIIEGDASPIDTTAEATTLANSALADLKDPKADQEIVLPFFWPGELGDLYRFSANGVHYNTDQDWAVVNIVHDLSPSRHETRIRVRGKPAGQYLTWLGRGSTIGGGVGTVAKPPYPFISPLNTESNELTWNLRFNAVNGSGGGGTNLTYTVKRKKDFASETTLSSGNASAFPLDLSVTRDPKQNAVLTFRVTDAATGLFAEETWPIPSINPFQTAAGNVDRTYPFSDGAYAVKAEDTAGQTIATGGKGKSDFAVKNSGGSTSFGTNRHNDEQIAINGDAKTFGVSFDAIPQIRALPQSFLIPGASSTVDRVFEFKATGVTVSGYTARAVSSTGSTSTPQTDDFAPSLNGTPDAGGILLENPDAAAYCNLADANTTLTTYTAKYDVDTTDMAAENTVYVDLYRNDGVGSTSWTLVGSRSFGSGVNTTNNTISFNAALADDWDTRIVISYETAPSGPAKAHITCQQMDYNVITAGTETALTTAAGTGILFQAMEAP